MSQNSIKAQTPDQYKTRIHGPVHRKDGFVVFYIRDYADGRWWRYQISCKPPSSSIYIQAEWKDELLIIDCDMVDEITHALKTLKALQSRKL